MTLYERRSTEAPMEIDHQGHADGRLAYYATGVEERPAKRHHGDIQDQPGLLQHSTPSRIVYQKENAPLMFAAQGLRKPQSYDPNRFPRQPINCDFSAQAQEARSQEIEMATDSPARLPLGESHQNVMAPAAAAVAESSSQAMKATGTAVSNAVVSAREIAVGGVKRILKKREEVALLESDDESEGGHSQHEETPTKVVKKGRRRPRSREAGAGSMSHSKSEHHYTLHMPAPAVAHSELPAILLGYVQFIFNATLVLVFLFIVIQVILTIRRDVQDKYEEYSTELLQEIADCSNSYLVNNCDPVKRLPYMETPCKNWETCMNRDPTVVGRARLSAETLGEIVNGFVEPISWKTLIFSLSTLACLITVTNSALFNLRARAQPMPHYPQVPLPPLPNDVQRLQQMGGQQVGWQQPTKAGMLSSFF